MGPKGVPLTNRYKPKPITPSAIDSLIYLQSIYYILVRGLKLNGVKGSSTNFLNCSSNFSHLYEFFALVQIS